ncbi:MAG TPA: nitroreductase/quinone reductase family protein [Ktedonobacterales bacterium]|nr:nitroreductase/quinone reductase family protein [Ktedonobacterales bacterium]
MSTAVPKRFDANLKNQLAREEEIQIETRRPGAAATPHRTTIWVVLVGDDVFVRSVRGNAGRWYQEIKANPTATLHVAGRRIPVRAIPANDLTSVTRVSDAYRQKYSNSSEMPSMVRDEILPTTLRLEPM